MRIPGLDSLPSFRYTVLTTCIIFLLKHRKKENKIQMFQNCCLRSAFPDHFFNSASLFPLISLKWRLLLHHKWNYIRQNTSPYVALEESLGMIDQKLLISCISVHVFHFWLTCALFVMALMAPLTLCNFQLWPHPHSCNPYRFGEMQRPNKSRCIQ